MLLQQACLWKERPRQLMCLLAGLPEGKPSLYSICKDGKILINGAINRMQIRTGGTPADQATAQRGAVEAQLIASRRSRERSDVISEFAMVAHMLVSTDLVFTPT
jgi:hypothetical protein